MTDERRNDGSNWEEMLREHPQIKTMITKLLKRPLTEAEERAYILGLMKK